jgi:DNA-binding PadR family transcriptional regulator
MTVSMLKVLDLLLSDIKRDDWFSLEVCRSTDLGSGTVVQIFFRLEQWGWVESTWEDVGAANHDRRPRRKFYRMTGMGARKAQQVMENTLPRSLRFRPA